MESKEMMVLIQCMNCRNFGELPDRFEKKIDKNGNVLPTGPYCLAFPYGIPKIILDNDHDHRLPFPGDNDILFLPKSEFSDNQQREIIAWKKSFNEEDRE
jgi:hypothetical protein